jgi:hypothetical protein
MALADGPGELGGPAIRAVNAAGDYGSGCDPLCTIVTVPELSG